ncbi:hypothetical protein TNCT_516601 [Trichonephila clavata]|uniref:Methyltransferase n=1 Tax=Trichonephila clavata TaxID=2740835 RepID=A0A8X6F5M4_TRICU|nr:hypothetical protein TNCT_516601 [Trichonephila clavata]
MAQAMPQNEQMLEHAREFIKRCKTELNWKDLSNDIVMDIGCGVYLLCCRALLEEFPRMGCLLAGDKFDVLTTEIWTDSFF